MRKSLALIVSLAGIGAAEAQDLPISLEITGKDGAQVKGSCVLLTTEGSETIKLDQTVPVSVVRNGMSLGCRLEAKGRISIVAKRGKSTSRSTLQNGTATVQVE